MKTLRTLALFIFLLSCFASAPAQTKLQNLTPTTTTNSSDVLYVVINPTTTPADRKITVDNLFLSRTGNKNLTAYASLSAAITAIGSTQAVIEIPATTTVSATLTSPANITLSFTGAGMVSVSSGQTLTINGPLQAPLRQIFTGSGSVKFGSRINEGFPEHFGAAGNGSTNDAAAIQACINAFSGTSLRAGKVKLTGSYVINSTVTISYSDILIEGSGWGYITGTQDRGILKWNGIAGDPMLLFNNTVHSGVRDLRIVGKSTAKPSAAIEFRDSGGGGIQDQSITERVWIGTDLSGEADAAVGLEVGILFSGLVNGDSGLHQDIHLHGCDIGVHVENVNAGVQHFNNVVTINCDTGFKIAAPQILVSNWNSGACGNDLEIARQGVTVTLHNYVSESSGRIVEGTDTGPMRLVIDGGGFQCDGNSARYQSADITGKRFITKFFGSAAGNGLWLEIRNFNITQANSPLTPIIQAWNTADGLTPAGGTDVYLRLHGVLGITSANIDVGSDGLAVSHRIVEFNNQSNAGGSTHPR